MRKLKGRKARQLHRAGLVQNFGPKQARQRRELARLTAGIRKVFVKRPGLLVLWVERDWAQARANGASWLSSEKLTAPYSGRIVGVGGRALLVLRGRKP